MSDSWPRQNFPNLKAKDYNIKSPATKNYNCIAWAASNTSAWWWPDDPVIGYGHWPDGVPREATIPAFILAYRTLGYEPCGTSSLEEGFEKIALYALPDGSPTHAARQLKSGLWTSKLGDFEDIEHTTLGSLTGPLYGDVVAYLKRRLTPI